jgi:DnaJ-class molecular chaperone
MADEGILQCPICHGGGQLSWDDTPEGPTFLLKGDIRVTTCPACGGTGVANRQ